MKTQCLFRSILERTSLSRRQFRSLYLAPLERYAELVQQFPASEAHHHAWPGGMLDHGLEIVAYALKLRQSHLLPAGASPEAQAAQAEAWTAGTAYAALLHDIGKIAVDLHVEQADGLVWHPWHGPLRQPYRFRYRTDREYRLHGAATGLLYTRVLDAGILDWLSDYQDLWSALLYVLAGQYEHAGTLGELVVKADQASVALALGGDPARAMAAPKHALQRKLLDGLRYLLREEFKLNQPGGPSDGWLTPEALWLVSKTVSDKLRAHLLSQGIEGIPSNNTAVFTVLQDHGIVQPAPDGKAIWRAIVTSGTGWSHSFTFLRLSPALIWESGERPAPFAGTVTTEEALPGDEAAPASAGIPATSPSPGVADSPAGIADPVSDLLSGLDDHEEDSLSLKDEVTAAADNELVKLVNKIIIDAYRQGASDIHIEPRRHAGSHQGHAVRGRLHCLAQARHRIAQAHHQRCEGTGAYRRWHGVPGQPRCFPALRAGTSGDPGAGPAGRSARLAMDAKALREAGAAPIGNHAMGAARHPGLPGGTDARVDRTGSG